MNEKIRNTINIMKKKFTFRINMKKITGFSKMQKKSVIGVVGVLTLGTILSVTPMVSIEAPLGTGNEIALQQRSSIEKGVNETQWLIKIGGKLVLAVETEEDAWAVFEGLKSYYTTDNSQVDEVSFSQGIEIEEYNYSAEGGEPAWVMNVADAIDYIIRGTLDPKIYVVQGGDTLWDIARNNGMTIEELEQMNPKISSSKLTIGSKVNLYESKPFLDIITKETIVATETIPYETTYEETTSMYRGQSKVKVAGTSGSKQVTSEITKQNGVLIASNVLDEQVLLQPQNQISLKGTAAIPAYTGSGNGVLNAPMAHVEVSSPFGASRGSRRHAGVDLRNPKGTPIGAAADGVVILAEYSRSYGNLVKIDHGGGLQTYYAHCDSMSVSVGDTVTKGQTIATVGRTGNATGYILHFEVRVNGVAKNPMNYI